MSESLPANQSNDINDLDIDADVPEDTDEVYEYEPADYDIDADVPKESTEVYSPVAPDDLAPIDADVNREIKETYNMEFDEASVALDALYSAVSGTDHRIEGPPDYEEFNEFGSSAGRNI